MSDLQIGLVALGVALIAAVLGLNWWQDRRARLHVQRHFGEFSGVADPLAWPIAPERRATGAKNPRWALAPQNVKLIVKPSNKPMRMSRPRLTPPAKSSST